MSSSLLNLTDDQKGTIHLLGALGLLHDIGKLTSGFVQSQSRDSVYKFSYEHVVNPFTVYYYQDLESRLDGPENKAFHQLFSRANDPQWSVPFRLSEGPDVAGKLSAVKLPAIWSGDDGGYNLAELILLTMPRFAYRDLEPIFRKKMQPAQLVGALHGIAHYEKEKANEGGVADEKYRQRHNQEFAATPFGYETPVVDLDRQYRLLPLELLLNDMSYPDWLRWSDAMADCMKPGLADTRRSTNEVSLWDWGYVVACLSRIAAAQVFIGGWPASIKDLQVQPLHVRVNELALLARGDRIGDVLGVRDELDVAYRAVRELLEFEYAFGARFSHDEYGEYYLCPPLGQDKAVVTDRIALCFPADLRPEVVSVGDPIPFRMLDSFRFKAPDESDADYEQVSNRHEKDRRSAISRLVADPRKQAQDTQPMLHPDDIAKLDIAWSRQERGNAEVCVVCRLRPVGSVGELTEDKLTGAPIEVALEQNICRVCLDRRQRRSADWLLDQQRTIWTDEVADNSGRLALLVGRLPLDDWLNGQLLDTLLVKENPRVTKNPSPARLYRISEEARGFWKTNVEQTIPGIVPDAPYRLLITLDRRPAGVRHGHAYELDFEQFTLQVVWDNQNKYFITAENLAGALRRLKRRGILDTDAGDDWFADNLENQHVDVANPSGFLQPAVTMATDLKIITVRRTEAGYNPTLSLLTEPGLAMVLIPATHALNVAQAINARYRKHFARVADRLPIHLGLVFFDRRTPLAAVLDAGRRFLEMPAGWESWSVKSNEADTLYEKPKNGSEREVVYHRLELEHGSRAIVLHYPQHMGDNETKDIWYPYLKKVDNPNNNGAEVEAIVHVEELSSGATVRIRPSYLDYSYLDAVSRRFEIRYDQEGRRPDRPTRPFLLSDLEELLLLWRLLSEGLETSQITQIIFRIEATRDAWRREFRDGVTEVFRQFVTDTLKGATWRSKGGWPGLKVISGRKDIHDVMIAAGADGVLADLAELHLEILGKARESRKQPVAV